MGQPPKSMVEVVNIVLKERHQLNLYLRDNLRKAHERMKKFADNKRSERKFSIGDWVYLKMQNYRQVIVQGRVNAKLSPKYCGPFEVLEKIGEVAYKLNLLLGSQVHPVFHVSQLKKRIGRDDAVSPSLPIVNPDSQDTPQPEYILSRRMVKKNNVYSPQILVKWSNQTDEEATWESYDAVVKAFPHINLEDKIVSKGDGVLEAGIDTMLADSEKGVMVTAAVALVVRVWQVGPCN